MSESDGLFKTPDAFASQLVTPSDGDSRHGDDGRRGAVADDQTAGNPLVGCDVD